MLVRSLDGVKHTSRSLRGMNHLGSGHVLMNTGKPAGRADHRYERESVRHRDTHYGTFAANRQQPAASEKIFRGKATSGNVLGLVGC